MAAVERGSKRVVKLVHVCSRIPNLVSEMTSKCPGLQFVDVPVRQNTVNTEQLQDAEILIADPPSIGPLLYQFPKLKWLQSTFAGIDGISKYVDRENVPSYTLTRFGGVFGPPMAEHVLLHIIAKERRLREVWGNQEHHIWDEEFAWNPGFRLMSQLSVGILGLGEIGKEIARVCKALGITIWAIGRRQRQEKLPNVDQYRTLDLLPEVLQSCDYFCNVLPSTSATHHLLSGSTLECCMEKKPVFINVGRGDIIDEASLVNALQKGWISGAILDVFEKEPLPKDSLLWDMPQVTITPHYAAVSFPFQVMDVFLRNLELYEAGKPLNYAVDWKEQY